LNSVLGLYFQKKEVNALAHVISNDCTNCGACVDSCPVNAINAGDSKHDIDADTCIDCGACVDTCPTSAISPA
jgi:ferredoxin